MKKVKTIQTSIYFPKLYNDLLLKICHYFLYVLPIFKTRQDISGPFPNISILSILITKKMTKAI